MLGNGLSGISMNVLRAILEVTLPGVENEYKVSLIYFSLATAILLACSIGFSVLHSQEFFQYYKKLSEQGSIPTEE
jgi:hypothetical protein